MAQEQFFPDRPDVGYRGQDQDKPAGVSFGDSQILREIGGLFAGDQGFANLPALVGAITGGVTFDGTGGVDVLDLWGSNLRAFLGGADLAAPDVDIVALATNFIESVLNPTGALASSENLTSLEDRQQKLENVVGFGCLTMPGLQSSQAGGRFRLPFTAPIGPLVGVSQADDGFVLNSRGLWIIDAAAYFDFYTLGSNQVDMDIRVYAPDGSLFKQRLFHDENAGQVSTSSFLPVTVPTAGYKVQVWAQAAVGRGILGGDERAGLTVDKKSTETS